jgi:hypothetical protein
MLQDVIALLGIANPQLALTWHESGSLSEDASLPMRLTGSVGEWHAPAAGLLNQAFASRLTMPDGSTPSGQPWVLCLHPQVWLRLSRLYGVVLEARTAQTDRPQRPVPRYFAYHGTSNIGEGPKGGAIAPGGRLELTGGNISVHDDAGRPIDAAATVSAFVAVMTAFPAIVAKDFSVATAPNIPNSQLGQFASGLTTDEVRVRLMSLFGVPFTNGDTKLTNVTAVNAASGVYRLNNPGQPILIVSVPVNPNERLVVGPATFGTLDRTFTIQPLSTTVPLAQLGRDFLSLFVDDLNLHLRGRETAVAPFAGQDFVVPTFHDEDVSLLLNGNQALAAAGQAVTGAAGLSLVVSPVIESDFDVAADAAAADWPIFPAGGDGTIAGRLENVALSAHFLAAPADTRDVFLRMEVPEKTPGVPQLAPGTAVRIYNRKFLADAREGRGNGAGGVLDANRTMGFLLTNPFGLRKDEGRPTNPTLSFDLIAANRTGAKRSFGLLGTTVAAPRALDAAETALASRGTNPFNTAPERGVSPAGVLGLPAPPLSGLPTITDLAAAIDIAISLGDETASPRVAPRLPTMTRNETIVAGRDAAGNWSAVVGGLWVRKDSRSGLHRLGSPGGPGGEEFLGASVRSRNGLFAQELARTALRRTRGISSRLTALDQDARWTPALVAAPAGTISAALLQDIAPAADSPNLGFIPDTVLDSLPPDWTGVVNALNTLIPANVASNSGVRNAINSLASSAKGLLLYSELRRELFTARRGRRDAVAVLRSALKAARELIYIETSAFSYTGYLDNNPSNPENVNDPPDPNTDLVTLITGQLAVQPGLKVLIGVSKESPAGRGYESFAARAYDRRKRAFEDLRAVDPARVTLFHPLGFPGRPLRLMHTVIVVDDMWLFVGSGSFTRRGVLFDGNLSVAMVDRQIEAGRSRAIRAFRRQLMEQHLAAVPVPGSPAQDFPSANRARVTDLNESYFAFRDTLDQGGAGLIEKLFDGVVTGQTPIPVTAFPHRDLADPDGSTFPVTAAALFQLFAGLGEAEA